jgi:hypothetical protein
MQGFFRFGFVPLFKFVEGVHDFLPSKQAQTAQVVAQVQTPAPQVVRI